MSLRDYLQMTKSQRGVVVVPPSAMVKIDWDEGTSAAIPLWSYWLKIAARESDLARAARSPDAHIDAMSLALSQREDGKADSAWTEPETSELEHAMVAIVAAAHAVDGFYGSVVQVITPGTAQRRPRRILETLKRGFSVGEQGHRWLVDLDWLFERRDLAVHHAERLRPAIVVRVTEQTALGGAVELYEFSAETAERATSIAEDVLSACLAHPREAMRTWVGQRSGAVGQVVTVSTRPTRLL